MTHRRFMRTSILEPCRSVEFRLHSNLLTGYPTMRFFSGATAVVRQECLPAEWIAGVQKAEAYSFRYVEAPSEARMMLLVVFNTC